MYSIHKATRRADQRLETRRGSLLNAQFRSLFTPSYTQKGLKLLLESSCVHTDREMHIWDPTWHARLSSPRRASNQPSLNRLTHPPASFVQPDSKLPQFTLRRFSFHPNIARYIPCPNLRRFLPLRRRDGYRRGRTSRPCRRSRLHRCRTLGGVHASSISLRSRNHFQSRSHLSARRRVEPHHSKASAAAVAYAINGGGGDTGGGDGHRYLGWGGRG